MKENLDTLDKLVTTEDSIPSVSLISSFRFDCSKEAMDGDEGVVVALLTL